MFISVFQVPFITRPAVYLDKMYFSALSMCVIFTARCYAVRGCAMVLTDRSWVRIHFGAYFLKRFSSYTKFMAWG